MPRNAESSGEEAARESLGLHQDVGDSRREDELRLKKAKAEMADWHAEQARAKSTEIAQGLADETREPAGTRSAEDEELLANSRDQVTKLRDSLMPPANPSPVAGEPYLKAREWGSAGEKPEDAVDEA